MNENDGLLKQSTIDFATLGSLCVDIVLNVPELPPQSMDERKAYLDQLLKSPPPHKKHWEAGANCNVAIAAARMGLSCITIGNVGEDIYGRFLLDVLCDEGIRTIQISGLNSDAHSASAVCETLKCWVLVDPFQGHDFWSNNKAAALSGELCGEVKMAIKQSKLLFCDCYVFYELPHYLIVSALEYAVEVGTSIFFDPGPKGKSFATGTPEEQNTLDKFLKMSDVLLLTSEEAESLTGIGNPILAGQWLVKKGVRTKWVIVKMGSKGSILITKSTISCAPGFKVNVADTVGCGDSFTAAIAFGYIHNSPLLHTLTLANAVGAATATGSGAGRNVATLEKVKKVLMASDLHEDENLWGEWFDGNMEDKDIEFLTNMMGNGSIKWINRVSLQNVVTEVLQSLNLHY